MKRVLDLTLMVKEGLSLTGSRIWGYRYDWGWLG